jgi:hypothetical protein
VNFLVLANFFFSEHFQIIEIGKSWTVTNLSDMSDTPKLLHCNWQGTFGPPTTDVQVHCIAEETNLSCPVLQILLSYRIPEVMKEFDIHFFVYSIAFWDTFLVDETQSIKGNVHHTLAFPLV